MVRSTGNLDLDNNDLDNVDHVSGTSGEITMECDIEMAAYDITGADRISGDEGYIDLDYLGNVMINANSTGAELQLSSDTIIDIAIGDWIDMNKSDILDCGDIQPEDIVTTGDIYPSASPTYDLGTSVMKWDNIYVVTVHEGDHVYSEKVCELCGEDFKDGEALVSYVLSNTEEGTRCIPVHLNCMIKPENQTKAAHTKVINNLKADDRYIDPIKSHQKAMEKSTKNLEKLNKFKEIKEAKEARKEAEKGKIIEEEEKHKKPKNV